jgi:hypothetical protein
MYPNPPLQLAIRKLYEAFAGFPRPSRLDASPLREPVEIQRLVSVPREMLGVDAMGGYAIWAMTTVGEVKDYKYFLPRLLELAVESGVIEPEMIAYKLQYGQWTEWAPRERGAVSEFLFEAFSQAMNEHPDDYLAASWFTAICILGLDIDRAMRAWRSASLPQAVLQLAGFLQGGTIFEASPEERGYWSNVEDRTLSIVRSWLLSADVRALLNFTKLSTADHDIWLLDRALETQDELTSRRAQ